MIETYGLALTSAPASEPLLLAEAKLHLRVDHSEEDGLITALITAARQHCEKVIGQAFVTQTWRLSMDYFPAWEIRVPLPPLQSVSSITYRDLDGDLQTLSSSLYDVDTDEKPGRITPVYGECWPSTRQQTNAVKVTFVAGYGAATAVPEAIKTAMRLLIGHWYENREAVVTGTIATSIPMAVESLLAGFWSGTY